MTKTIMVLNMDVKGDPESLPKCMMWIKREVVRLKQHQENVMSRKIQKKCRAEVARTIQWVLKHLDFSTKTTRQNY